VKKEQGHSWIEVNSEVHSFVAADQDYPKIADIHAEWMRLSGKMKDSGYMVDMNFVLHDVEEGEMPHFCKHSEKLAIAFGLISTASGTPLCIFTNSRVCGKCHASTKLITKIVGRVIIVRDPNRFHHFEDVICSCRDYW
jgi:hypothetical protein